MYTYSDIVFPVNIPDDTRFFVVMGSALNGPVDTPFMLEESTDPYEVLGNCRMADNYLVARKHGINPLVVRLNGSHGELTLTHERKGEPFLHFKTLEAHDECNRISVRTFPTHLYIEGLHNTFTYYFKDFPTAASLASEIETDLHLGNGEVEVEVLRNFSMKDAFQKETQYFMSGADDGSHFMMKHDGSDTEETIERQLNLLRRKLLDEEIDEDDFFEGKIYYTSELEIYQIDTVLFTDIPYERAAVEMSEIFGRFAEAKTFEQNIHCSVVLCSDLFNGERTEDIETGIDNYTEDFCVLLENSPYNLYDEILQRGDSIDWRLEELLHNHRFLRHLEVVVGIQEGVRDSHGQDTMPCAATFASNRYRMEYHISPTNKTIASINTLYSQELTQDEVANLADNGYTCIVATKGRGFVPYATRSLYPHVNSFRAKPHYLRSVCLDVYRITRLFDRHIGQPVTESLISDITLDVSDIINQILKIPIYRNITFEFTKVTYDKIDFLISFEMYGEIEKVKTSYEYVPSREVNVIWS